jgi:hypothetical protein
MDPSDPPVAQQIVVAYVRFLERQAESGDWPARLDSLPYPKPTIKTAIQTSAWALASTGQLSDEMREFLETAYVTLADYIEPDLARLMGEYQRAGAALAADQRLAREKLAGDAWRNVSETSSLAGEIARNISEEAEGLRHEFRALAARGRVTGEGSQPRNPSHETAEGQG